MPIEEAYKRVTSSQIFQEQGFLCNVFMMADAKELETTPWQFGFYNPKTKTMNSYKDTTPIQIESKDEKIFQEEDTPIEELKLETIEISIEEALQIAKKKLKEKNEAADKIIIVLQQQKIPIWNISFLTSTFNLLNLKLNAKKKQILNEKYTSLLSFKNE